MHRYLLNISYIGTPFRGVQKTINKSKGITIDTNSIQGCVEVALNALRPVNDIQTVLSSRTDSGVHALHSTLHVDLQKRNNEPYDPLILTGVLNRTLNKQNLPIRILSSQLVSNSFHCRYHALSRTYLYRFAVQKNNTNNPVKAKRNKGYESFIPIEEQDRCFFLHDCEFKIERLKAASLLFEGLHDFRTFMSTSRENNLSRLHPRFTLRKIDKINVRPGKTLAIGENAIRATELYDYWEIEFKAKSFLYKQIRRLVGTLFAFAVGRINERHIYEMLTIPSKHSWYSGIELSPSHGLYLCNVAYDNKYLEREI